METRGQLYREAILAWLNDTARRAMLEYLNVHRNEWQSEIERRYVNDGRREVLIKQLGLRFGDLPASVLQRLLAADDTDLDRWTERVLTAATVDAVFADGTPAADSNSLGWNIHTDFVGLCIKAGRIGGQQQMLTKICGLKFGELPEWALSRLRLGLEPDLERWTERVLNALTLDEVFAG